MWKNQLANKQIGKLWPYEPGKPIDELKRELGLDHIVKLASNENPLGPSPKALEAVMASIPDLHRYPDGAGYILKKAISDKYKVQMKQLTLGNGSNDVLELLMRVFVGENDSVVYSQFAFAVYSIVTQAIGAKGIEVPAQHFGHNLQAMLAAIQENTKMVIIANPNNPTGTWLAREALIEFMQNVPSHIIVVIDEAYVEYPENVGYGSLINDITDFENLIVTRTFSKAYGMAGLRAGFMVATLELTDWVNRVRQPFNVNSLALVGAAAALQDDAHLERGIDMTREGLSKLQVELAGRGISYIPSAANFITIETENPSRDVFKALLKEGVITRALDAYAMPNHLRVSIGLPEENAFFIQALDKVRPAQ